MQAPSQQREPSPASTTAPRVTCIGAALTGRSGIGIAGAGDEGHRYYQAWNC
jgi:hypothetical protein